MELHLRLGTDGIHEILRPAELPESTAFAGDFRPGQRVEIHESYRHWLRGWASEWTSGSMLTIDYGDTMPGLYHRRTAGTIRGYAHHQRLTGLEIYQAPGRLDLTADVNYSDLQKWGEDLGWRTTRHGTLDEVLDRAQPQTTKAGPGRPRLGVVSTEVTLLPRHWDWLNAQPARASGTLRRLVEDAMAREASDPKKRREVLGKILWALAGNEPGFEEATRALYAGDSQAVQTITSRWSGDLPYFVAQWLAG